MAIKQTMKIFSKTGKLQKTVPFRLHPAKLGKYDMVRVTVGKDIYWVDRHTKSGKPRLIKESKATPKMKVFGRHMKL